MCYSLYKSEYNQFLNEGLLRYHLEGKLNFHTYLLVELSLPVPMLNDFSYYIRLHKNHLKQIYCLLHNGKTPKSLDKMNVCLVPSAIFGLDQSVQKVRNHKEYTRISFKQTLRVYLSRTFRRRPKLLPISQLLQLY